MGALAVLMVAALAACDDSSVVGGVRDAGGMDAVVDVSCAPSRVCFHTSGAGGYRCGDNGGLNGSTAYERIFFTNN